jgi:hypothetical protein
MKIVRTKYAKHKPMEIILLIFLIAFGTFLVAAFADGEGGGMVMKKVMVSILSGIILSSLCYSSSLWRPKHEQFFDKYDFVGKVQIEKVEQKAVLSDWREKICLLEVNVLETLYNPKSIAIQQLKYTFYNMDYADKYEHDAQIKEGNVIAVGCKWVEKEKWLEIGFLLSSEVWDMYQKQKEDGFQSFPENEYAKLMAMARELYIKRGMGEITDEGYKVQVEPYLPWLKIMAGYNVEEEYELWLQMEILGQQWVNNEISLNEHNQLRRELMQKIQKMRRKI